MQTKNQKKKRRSKQKNKHIMLYLFDDICAHQSHVFSYVTTRVLSSADKLCSVCRANQLFIISSKGEKKV